MGANKVSILGIVVHRVKKAKFFLALAAMVVVMFYYSFQNESYDLNQVAEVKDLPKVITETAKAPSKEPEKTKADDVEESSGNNVDAAVNEQLSKIGEGITRKPLLKELMEKNKYYPLLEAEHKSTKLGSFKLPEEYFNNQHSKDLREAKKKQKPFYPVGKENYFKLPKVETPPDYPKIQTKKFTDGGAKVESKLNKVKQVFNKSWKLYTKHGYGHDEVLPLSKTYEDPFNGWAATLVDSLDTLYIMGDMVEFNKAVKFVEKINFKQSYREDIPIFENVIRILGGLISAYDLSGEEVLLKSAVDSANLFMEAFDTPNRMPLLYYNWKDHWKNKLASQNVGLAEVGTLSLEFTRLSQITGDNQYFDAITRITEMFKNSVNDFHLPGLIPNDLDISGCKELTPQQVDEGLHLGPNVIKAMRRNGEFVYCQMQAKFRPTTIKEYYSLGGIGDSYYEYLPKMYHMLRDDKFGKDYKQLFLSAAPQIEKYMLFHPKLPNGEKVLHASVISAQREPSSGKLVVKQDLDFQHLSCFAGGMFAMSGKLFQEPKFVDIGEKITMGCVELYREFGVMPEVVVNHDKMETGNDVYDEKVRLEELKDDSDRFRPDGNRKRAVVDKAQLLEEDKRKQTVEKHNARVKLAKAAAQDTAQGEARAQDKAEVPVQDEVQAQQLKQKQNTKDKAAKEEQANIALDVPVVMKNEVMYSLPPPTVNSKGEVTWSVGEVKNQPLYFNKIDPRYILRPEAIESVYYMYRITGDSKWREYGWMMFENVIKLCETSDGYFAAVKDITDKDNTSDERFEDSLESFWFAETLKYYYLLFEDAGVYSFDDYVFNTEAHLFKIVK